MPTPIGAVFSMGVIEMAVFSFRAPAGIVRVNLVSKDVRYPPAGPIVFVDDWPIGRPTFVTVRCPVLMPSDGIIVSLVLSLQDVPAKIAAKRTKSNRRVMFVSIKGSPRWASSNAGPAGYLS